jgi:hypothetical protein
MVLIVYFAVTATVVITTVISHQLHAVSRQQHFWVVLASFAACMCDTQPLLRIGPRLRVRCIHTSVEDSKMQQQQMKHALN